MNRTLNPKLDLDQKGWQQFTESHGNAKRDWTGRSTICLHNAQSTFHTRYNPNSYRVTHDDQLAKSLLKIPLLPRYIEIGTAMIGTNFVEWQVTPEAMTHEARVKADAVNVLIDQYESANSVFVNNQHIAAMMLTLGHAAKRLYQDYEWQIVELPPEEAQIYEQLQRQNGVSIGEVFKTDGGMVRIEAYLPVIKEQYISPFRIIVETGARDLESCNRFVVYEDRPRTDIARFFPEFDIESVRPDTIPDTHSPSGYVAYQETGVLGGQQTGNSYDSMLALNRVYWCYERLGNGRWVETIYIGEKLKKVLSPGREIQFHPIVWYYAPGRKLDEGFWQYGVVDRCVDLQRAISRSATDQKLNFHALMKDTILVPQNMRNQITNAYASVLWYDPRSNNMPRRLEMPTNTHQVLREMLQSDEAQMARLMGVHDMSQGVVKSHVSGQAAAASISSTTSPLSLISDGIDAAEEIKIKKMLRFQRAIFDEPRFFASVGKNAGQTYAKTIQRADLLGYLDVKPVLQSRIPRDQQTRLQLGMQLATAGMFSQENSEAIQRFKEFVQIEKGTMPLGIDSEIERHRAMRALQLIREDRVVSQGQLDPQTMQVVPAPLQYVDKTGNLAPLLSQLDDNVIHQQVISQAIREEQFANPQHAALAMQLLEEHKQVLDRKSIEAMTKQLEMEAKRSVATQAGQIAMQAQSAMLNAPVVPKAKMTPAQGGILSGQVRRAQ